MYHLGAVLHGRGGDLSSLKGRTVHGQFAPTREQARIGTRTIFPAPRLPQVISTILPSTLKRSWISKENKEDEEDYD